MNIRKMYILFIMGILCILLCSCSKQNLTTSPPTATISPFPYYSNVQFKDVNRCIRLSLFPPATEKLRQNYSINLLIENTSETLIEFPIDWGEKIYQYRESDASWQEVKNRVTYAGKAITLSPKGDDEGLSSFQISAIPTITQGENQKIRIIVSGNTVPDNKPVLAYIDLILQP
jgi:hypothetical protein